MQREFEARGFTVVGVTSHDTVADIRDFQQDIKQDYTVLLGSEDTPQKFNNGPGLPVSYILDREGRIRERIIGPRTRDGFEASIKPLLDEAAATASAAQTSGSNY